MRRAFRLSVLVLLLSCSDEGDERASRDPNQGERDPVTRSDEDDEDAEEDADKDDEDDAQEEERTASDAAAASSDSGSVRSDAGVGPTTGQDAGSLDATTELDAASAVDAGANADAAEASAQASEAGQEAGAPGEAGADEVACIDQQIAQLILFEAPAPSLISEEGTQPGSFSTLIDATGGGLSTTQSFVYARFTSGGLEKLAIGDEAAFASSSWHIAARRYVLRVNSGVSGPGTVRAARTAPGTTFEGLDVVPDGLVYRTEQYYTESCEFVPDTSGVGAPATALSSFWSYAGCVKMTNNVFVLELPEQHHVKLQVVSYYPPENQQRCNQTDTITTPSGAGNLRIRWAFLD